MAYIIKKEKPFVVYLAGEKEPVNLMACTYAEVVHKAIEHIRKEKLLTTIERIVKLELT